MNLVPIGLLAFFFLLMGCSQKPQEVATSKVQELKLPVEVTREPNSLEIARIWKTSGGQTVLLSPKDEWGPEEWGLMLTDLARHVANSKNLNSGIDKEAFLAKVKVALDKEWSSPTDTPTGRFGD